ncbi:phage tail protein [Bradyrhizobium daqingense]|uniref:Microcystin-dependent protein n=1 Tax=Bradyrhizobium daqingense TaxID=993502 RepID=A0A562LJW5_9BRAD|nr:tail fiber protein [Bradyrhizobium daqingense]TWI07876.1 microcystin-dependent protein [Bradyrhizobium daqingense]UFS89809.1 phage tail protein [Bradyrhizobium daqingense]
MSGLAWWSQTANSNANGNGDVAINMAEGMAPSAVNDSVRALMASAAKYRDDISGAIAATGTGAAYAVASYQSFDSLSRLANQVIAFTPHTTNTGTTTLNVDGLGAKPLRSAPSTELAAGHLVQGTPYVAVYNNSDAAFYLRGFYGNPYSLPVGGVLPFTGSTAPNSSFVLAYGQGISRTTYSTYFSLVGTTYGTGDGSSTFNIPDLRGRVIAGRDDMGGSAASRLSVTSITSGGPTTLGGSGGADTKTLATANLPPYTPAGTITNGAISISHNAVSLAANMTGGGAFSAGANAATITASQGASTFTGTAQGGTSTAFSLAQPTIILNYLLRII